jgi:ApaG protein
MVKQVAHNIKITVEAKYQDSYSSPAQRHYLFSYRITIENNSEFTFQLLRRHWYIFDSSSENREVEGEGVVGEQPVLMPGESYEYESACNLTTDMGKMHGTYTLVRKADGNQFTVRIPEFQLLVPYRMN